MGPAVTPIQIVKVPWTGGRDEVIILKCLMEKIGKICIFLLSIVVVGNTKWILLIYHGHLTRQEFDASRHWGE